MDDDSDFFDDAADDVFDELPSFPQAHINNTDNNIINFFII